MKSKSTIKPKKKVEAKKEQSSNTPPPANIFSLAFTTKATDNNKFKVDQISVSFDATGTPILMNGEEMTETGYQVLMGVLGDVINSFAKDAARQGINAGKLKEAVISKLETKVVKLIGV